MTKEKQERPAPATGEPMPQPQGRPVSADREPSRPPAPAADREVAEFIARMKSLARPATDRARLIFAMDATMSRQPTWDMALALQADMFQAVKELGGLDVQLVYFRGNGECRASKWVADPEALARLMTTVSCRGGYTQIRRVLTHARQEAEERRISALVYVGDCMEENPDELSVRAGELALHGVPVFLFQEGHDRRAEAAFREIARLSKGAYCRFDAGSARQLKELLSAVAVYAAGGTKALEAMGRGKLTGRGARLLLAQLK